MQALAAHQRPTDRQSAGMLRWLRRSGDQPALVPGGLAVATQQANRAHDRERELRQHQHRRQGWLEANAHLGPQYRQAMRTLAWQRRATGLAVEQERPGYDLEALGPVPAPTGAGEPGAKPLPTSSTTRTATRSPTRTGPSPRAPRPHPADRPATGPPGLEGAHSKQRATDRTRQRQPTSEHIRQPRPREQRGRPGPERAAG